MQGAFSHISINLQNTKEIENLPDFSCDVLIHCAGLGYFQPLETMRTDQIEAILDLNLKAPILLTKKLLRNLRERQGRVISVTSIEATRSSKFSAVYSASKSGLLSFSNALFEEVRKQHVTCTAINLGMTKTGFFDRLNFECSDDNSCHLQAHEVAKSILWVLEMPKESAMTEITLQPQRIGVKKKSQKVT
jgi:short-subunit dehydrogenase